LGLKEATGLISVAGAAIATGDVVRLSAYCRGLCNSILRGVHRWPVALPAVTVDAQRLVALPTMRVGVENGKALVCHFAVVAARAGGALTAEAVGPVLFETDTAGTLPDSFGANGVLFGQRLIEKGINSWGGVELVSHWLIKGWGWGLGSFVGGNGFAFDVDYI
jgi:hypothetical protein